MTSSEFNDLLWQRIQKIRQTLASKADEYASTDRLHNFKADVGGLETNETPMMVCWGYLRKHLQSMYDMISGLKPITRELINEKIGDVINYVILMEALMTEQFIQDTIKRAVECQIPESDNITVRDSTDEEKDMQGSD